MNIQSFGGRRFILTVGCGAVTSWLLYIGRLDSGAYTTIILATVGAYIGANTYQKVKAPDA